MFRGIKGFARPDEAAKAWKTTKAALRKRALIGKLARIPDPERPGQNLYALPGTDAKAKRRVVAAPPKRKLYIEDETDDLDDDLLDAEFEITQPLDVVTETDWDHVKHRARRQAKITVIHSDVHVPDNDKAAWRAWLQFITYLQPDRLIYLGDFLDMESFSSHDNLHAPPKSIDEIRAGREALRQTVDAVPDAERWLFEGNHEQRIRRKLAKNLPNAMDLMELPDLLDLKTLGFNWYEYPKKRFFGDVMYLHSTSEGMHHAHQALINQDANCVYGHIHRPQLHMKRTGSGRFLWAMGLGCGQDLNGLDGPEWMNGKASGWVHAIGVVMELPDGTSFPALVMIRDGRIVWDGMVFDGN
jgi:hypothetical protein